MKINLIGMIINQSRPYTYDGLLTDSSGHRMDAVQILDFLIMEYAKVRNGGQSDAVVIPFEFAKKKEADHE